MNDTRVAIVLVNWNGWRECIECLDSLMAQKHGSFHVYLVDNASEDGSLDHIASWCGAPAADPQWRRFDGVDRVSDRPNPGAIEYRRLPRFEQGAPTPSEGARLSLIRSDANLGFAGGCNLGIAAAGLRNYDYFWLLNPDTVVHRDALVELLAHAANRPDAGIFGSTVRYYADPDIVQAMGGARMNFSNGTTSHIGQGARLSDVPSDPAGVEKQMSYVMGASMLVSAKFIASIGPMEEDYFLYFEEADWALRGRYEFALGFAPRSHVFHKSGVNSSKVATLFSAGFYYRNRLRFVSRFMPDRLSAAKRSLIDQMLRHLARGRFGHARVVLATLLAARRITADVTRRPM